MKRFVEGSIAGRGRYFRSAWKTGSMRTIRFGGSMPLLTNSIYPSWGLTGSLPRQLADLDIIPLGC